MKTKPKVKYGILDCMGEVIRWQFYKPSSNYQFIKQRINRAIDFSKFEAALF